MSEPNSFSSDGVSGVDRFLISMERHGVVTPGALEEAVHDLCLRAKAEEERHRPNEGEVMLDWLARIPGPRGADGLAEPLEMSEYDWRLYVTWTLAMMGGDVKVTISKLKQVIAAHDRSAGLLARALKGEDPDAIMEALADDIAKWEEHRDV